MVYQSRKTEYCQAFSPIRPGPEVYGMRLCAAVASKPRKKPVALRRLTKASAGAVSRPLAKRSRTQNAGGE